MKHVVSDGYGVAKVLGNGLGAISRQEIQQSVSLVQQWVEQRGYRGYEPFDGLSSWLRPLACGNLLGDRLIQQLIRQSPLNLRPALGVKPKDSTKGRGYMAAGYVTLYRITKQPEYLETEAGCLA